MDGVNHYVCPFVEACERVKLELQSAKRKRAKKKEKKSKPYEEPIFSCVHTGLKHI
jgi:hypothetical protein